VLLPRHDPPTHKRLLCSLVFRRVKEYFKGTCTLAPFSLSPTSFNTTSTLTALHLQSHGYFPFFLEDYKLDQNLEISSISFKLAFQRMPHLLASAFGMVFEHL
jgi:hypothetical protein